MNFGKSSLIGVNVEFPFSTWLRTFPIVSKSLPFKYIGILGELTLVVSICGNPLFSLLYDRLSS